MEPERRAAAAFLPSGEQSLLLQACLLDGEAGVDSWRAWRNAVDMDQLELAMRRLTPVLAAKFKPFAHEDPHFRLYRDAARDAWARNKVLFHRAAKAVRAMADRGVPSVLLKGAPLALAYYDDISMRPMSDVDILVRRADVFQALDALEAQGWVCAAPRPRAAADLAVRHAAEVAWPDPSATHIDIHWRLLHPRLSDEAIEALWSYAQPIDLVGVAALAPCAADMLIHVCAHGARWNVFAPIRWVVDAAMVIGSGAVDWDHLTAQSRRLGVSLPMVAALGYLREALQVPVPASVLEALAHGPHRRIERVLFEMEQQPFDERRLLAILSMHLHIARSDRNLGSALLGFWRYLKALAGGRSPRQMVGWIATKAFARERRVFTRARADDETAR